MIKSNSGCSNGKFSLKSCPGGNFYLEKSMFTLLFFFGLSLEIVKYDEVRALGSGLYPANSDLLKALAVLPASISWLKVNSDYSFSSKEFQGGSGEEGNDSVGKPKTSLVANVLYTPDFRAYICQYQMSKSCNPPSCKFVLSRSVIQAGFWDVSCSPQSVSNKKCRI